MDKMFFAVFMIILCGSFTFYVILKYPSILYHDLQEQVQL